MASGGSPITLGHEPGDGADWAWGRYLTARAYYLEDPSELIGEFRLLAAYRDFALARCLDTDDASQAVRRLAATLAWERSSRRPRAKAERLQ